MKTIQPWLFQSGRELAVSELLEHRIDAIICLSHEPDRREIVRRVAYLWYPLDDSEQLPDEKVFWHVCELGSALRDRDLRLLVKCDAGWNRSGLVVAGVLRRSLGMVGTDISALIRQKEPMALSNPAFLAWVHTWGRDSVFRY